MPVLNLGVIDVPYENGGRRAPPTRITKKGRVHKADVKRAARAYQSAADDTGPNTTVKVARELEDKYHVMQVFYDHFEPEIAQAAVHSLEGALEDLYAGSPIKDPFAEMGAEVEQGFRQWLLQGEIETLGLEGIPTKAAQERKSSRFKKGVGPAERPSFIETGTYELAVRSWIDD